MDQKSFILYHDMWEQLSELSDEEIGKITRATFVYHSTGDIIDIWRLCNIVFKNIKTMLDRDRNKFDEYIARQSENGKKWWRPKKTHWNPTKPKKPTAFSKNPLKAKKADSDSLSDSGSDNHSYSYSETYTGKDTIVSSQAIVAEKYGNEEINNILEVIKGQVEFLWFIYKRGAQERQRAQNILTGKDFWEVCERANMTRVEFCKSIIYTSSLLPFWNGKINNAETLYKFYAQVYNDAVNKKQEAENRPRRWLEV